MNPDALSDKKKRQLGGGYTGPRQRDPHEALPNTIAIMSKKYPRYVPKEIEVVRPGADDHLKYRSLHA
jgi:hypothetical protein